MSEYAHHIIELQNVSRMYGFGEATTVALDNISLQIQKGEFVAIMGRSGSGKSTLMNIIGLLDNPTHGNYLLNGHHLSELSSKQRAQIRLRKIGFVFQSFNLLPKMNVIDNVALPLSYAGVSLERRLSRASKLLEALGLKEREYYYPNQLAGGQTQRVAIARALINKPDIILADEPTGNLDTITSENIMSVFSDLHQIGHTIIMVTHDHKVAKYASRIIELSDGRVIFDEPNHQKPTLHPEAETVVEAEEDTEEPKKKGAKKWLVLA